MEEPFHKYSINYRIGLGAYGEVYCATRSEDSRKFALKCFKDVFAKRGHTKSVLRELLFGRLVRHSNIMCIEEILVPADIANFSAIWVVYEKYDEDLKRWAQRMHLSRSSCGGAVHGAPQPSELSALRFIFFQVLQGLRFLHSCHIMHRDIKPDNILINLFDCHCVLADFNLSCLSQENRVYTEYTVTRWYRAPELLMGLPYSESVDIWALGCTLGELLLNQVLFKGRNSREQLEKVVLLLGLPEDAAFVGQQRNLNLDDFQTFHALPPTEAAASGLRGARPPLETLCDGLDADARDLLFRLLRWAPTERLSAEKALAHPFFAEVRRLSPKDAIDAAASSAAATAALSFGFDESKLSEVEIRQKLVQEIQFYHPKYYHLNV